MRIFCIGLNKTGTMSLHEAFETMGLRSLHSDGRAAPGEAPPVRRAVERAIEEGRPLLHYIDDYDAYSDIQRLSVSFRELDHQYPGSRFILNTRDVDDWLDSRVRHVERNRAMKEAGTYHGNFLEVDLPRWRRLFTEHHERVQAYFADRPDELLVMDVTRGDGYDVLCPFLGLPEPVSAFPWRHKDAHGVRGA